MPEPRLDTHTFDRPASNAAFQRPRMRSPSMLVCLLLVLFRSEFSGGGLICNNAGRYRAIYPHFLVGSCDSHSFGDILVVSLARRSSSPFSILGNGLPGAAGSCSLEGSATADLYSELRFLVNL